MLLASRAPVLGNVGVNAQVRAQFEEIISGSDRLIGGVHAVIWSYTGHSSCML